MAGFPKLILCQSLLLGLVLTGSLWAQSSSALINEALDKQVKLDLNDVLPQAMAKISNQTGVPIRADKSVWDLLPWGEDTNISAKIENQTLRQAIDAITRKLGLVAVLKEETVELQPMPALLRLGRRSTVQELQALDLLASTPLELGGVGETRTTVGQLLTAVDAKLEQAKSPFAIENRAFGPSNLTLPINVPRNASLMDALEELPLQTGATWYPWGKSIVVVTKEDQVRNQLAKTLSVRYNGVDVSQVLAELSQRCGVPFTIEPGAVRAVPPEFRVIKLEMENASIEQALQNICGFTGLAYVVNDKGVYLWNPTAAKAATAPAAGAEPMIGVGPLDNGMQVLIPESQFPGDLKQYIQFKTQQQIDKLRQKMNEEGFRPATQPAAIPTTQKTGDDL